MITKRRSIWLSLLLIVIIAVAFRFPALDSLPPGLNFDEGGEGVAALDVANGAYRIWWPIGGGKEPLMAYLVQPLFWLFGPTRLALRLYSALMGLGAVLATYFLARQLFYWRVTKDIAWSFLPLYAALGLATAFWHVAYSRIAFRALSNPAVEALALGFLWLALRTGKWRHFLLAGLFTGGLIYTYLAGRFVPVAIALFFALEALLAWKEKRQSLLVQYWQKLAGMVAAAIAVFLPLAIFFLQNPGAFVDRAGSVSIFSPAMNQGDFWGTLRRTIGLTLGTFLSLSGDPNPLGNIPGKPELSPLLALLFVVGAAYCAFCVAYSLISNIQYPISKGHNVSPSPAAPFLFLLIWFPIMLLPAILAPEGAPHHLRLIGTAPASYILLGLGLTLAGWWAGKLVSRAGGQGGKSGVSQFSVSLIFLFLVFGLTAFQTYRDYFIVWANEVDHYMPFDVYAGELANQIAAETDPGAVYVIPMDLRAAHEARHYSLDFLYQGETPFAYVTVDETTVAKTLTGIARGAETLKVVRWTADKHQQADARETVSFLLATAGAKLTGVETYPVYNIETYRLPTAQTQFALPAIQTPLEATFDGLIQARRAEVSLTPDGSQAAVAVTYAPIAPIAADYKASVRLVGPDGTVTAQKDRILLHNWHQPTSLWPREEVNEYYLLPFPAEALPGFYEVRLVIYHPETLAPLMDNGQAELVLGTVEKGQ